MHKGIFKINHKGLAKASGNFLKIKNNVTIANTQ